MHYIRVACVRALEASTSYFRSIAFAVLATLISLGAIEASAQIRYYYDELGRLVEVVAPDGQSAQYTYDALGNILGIKQLAALAVSISEFTPNAGPVGTTVTIYGSGYSSNRADTAGVKTISRIALVAGTNTVSITKDRGGIAIAASGD